MTGVGLFLIATLVFSAVMAWAFRFLPREEWQFLASVPRRKNEAGSWSGRNLTFYGFFTATAYVFAAAVFLLLAGSVGVSFLLALCLLAVLFALCVPASRWIALYVDKTKSGFTVAGATFVGLLALPAAVLLLNALGEQSGGPLGAGQAGGFAIPYAATLAAAAIAYCFGESVGRLACISFGCCYGKPLAGTRHWLVRLLGGVPFVFRGRTKKITYAAGLEGSAVFPVQALTAVLYWLTGLAGVGFFFASWFAEAFLVTVAVSQLWRAYSETLRADYRGEGQVTAYQWMALAAVPIAAGLAWRGPVENVPTADVAMGLSALWNPLAILVLQALWVALFLFTGVSETTGSVVSFHVAPGFDHRDGMYLEPRSQAPGLALRSDLPADIDSRDRKRTLATG